MKHIILLLLVLSSFAQAKDLELRVDKILCGEIDPYILGDACVVFASNQDNVYGLIMEIDEYLDIISDDINVSDLITLDNRYFSHNNDRNLANLLHRLGSELDSKLFIRKVSSLKYAFKNIKKSVTLRTYQLVCHEAYSTQDGMHTNVIIESLIRVKSFNTFEIEGTRLSYELRPENTPNSTYSSIDTKNPEFSQLDKRNFNPIKYDNHMKFADLYAEQTRGKVNLLLPIEKLMKSSRRKRFSGYLQLSSINGRFGTTVKLNCDILRTTRHH